MNENVCIREELQPCKDLFTFLINQNLQLTEDLKQIKIQMNKQYEHLTQQTKDYQFKIDRLEQSLNEQIETNQNLNNKFNLVEKNLNDRLTKLDKDQQQFSIQSKQHLQLLQHRFNYLGEFYRKTNRISIRIKTIISFQKLSNRKFILFFCSFQFFSTLNQNI